MSTPLRGSVTRSSAVMVICRKGDHSHQIRMALKTLGFTNLTSVVSHGMGLERLKTRNFQFVVFDAKRTDMTPGEFVTQAAKVEEGLIMIAASTNPKIDDVFGLLRAGARGFLAMPFTAESLEGVVERAKEGPPFSEAVLQAPDRNAALSGVVLNNLYRLSVLMRQSRDFESAARELPRQKALFSESVELGLLFCEGGDDRIFRDRIIEDCVLRASAAASRLGRTRQRLRKEREVEVGDAA
ncbi:MAG: hypothetical protein KDD69_14610 [Bdellovibrionales bacterium]|nr:hypothetical protein [Bdellovibrionales bacterium]